MQPRSSVADDSNLELALSTIRLLQVCTLCTIYCLQRLLLPVAPLIRSYWLEFLSPR
jgi:hypothetical protein